MEQRLSATAALCLRTPCLRAMRMSRLLVLSLLACACVDTFDVALQGLVLDGWDEDAPPASELTVQTLDEDGDEIDRATSAANGWFRVGAAPGVTNVVVIDGPEHVPTTFHGNPGLNPRFRIPNGEVFAVSEARWSEELERWEGCPTLENEGGVLLARPLFDGFIGGEDGEVVLVESSFATMFLNDGRALEPCYLNEEGVYDPLTFRVGIGGYLLVGGLPVGGHVLELTYEPVPGLERRYQYEIRLPPGAIAPRVPLLVPFEP